MRRTAVAAAAALALAFLAPPAGAQVAPGVWTDPETGCAYLVAEGAGMTPRLRRDGAPDCPEAGRLVSREVEDAARETTQGLGRALQGLGQELRGVR